MWNELYKYIKSIEVIKRKSKKIIKYVYVYIILHENYCKVIKKIVYI